MDNKINYLLVGIFVVALTTLMVVLGVWIAAYKNQKEYLIYRVYFQEAVSGLSEQSLVRFNGVPVGFVKKIALDPHNIKNVQLLLSIEQQVAITTATIATLKAQGLTGITHVELSAKSNTKELLRSKPDEAYPVIPYAPSLLLQLDTTLKEVTQDLKKMADGFHVVFNQENIRSIKTSLDNIAVISKRVAQHSDKIDRMLMNVDRVLLRTASVSEVFPQMIVQFKKVLNNVDHLSAQFKQAGFQANKLLSETQVAVSAIVSQLMPKLHQTLIGMSTVSSDLQQITEQVKYDPSVILRGKQHSVD